jgi:hypothetical protein
MRSYSRAGTHELAYCISHPNNRSRANFLTHRAVTAWNSIPTSAVTAPTLNEFKDAIDELFKQNRIRQSSLA